MEIFTVMESEIEKMFEGIIETAKQRKIEFLEELRKFKKRFVKKRDEGLASMKELEEKANKILAMNVEGERAAKILQNRLESINSEIEELRMNTQMPQFRIDTSDAKEIIDSVFVLGSIITTTTKTTDAEVGGEKIYYTQWIQLTIPKRLKRNFHQFHPRRKLLIILC